MHGFYGFLGQKASCLICCNFRDFAPNLIHEKADSPADDDTAYDIDRIMDAGNDSRNRNKDGPDPEKDAGRAIMKIHDRGERGESRGMARGKRIAAAMDEERLDAIDAFERARIMEDVFQEFCNAEGNTDCKTGMNAFECAPWQTLDPDSIISQGRHEKEQKKGRAKKNVRQSDSQKINQIIENLIPKYEAVEKCEHEEIMSEILNADKFLIHIVSVRGPGIAPHTHKQP
jgi:hypothetical protein